MKFCYVDESGTGDEPFAVMVGVIVDAQRMHVTKSDWGDLLAALSKICRKQISELHTRDFYAGGGIWYDLKGGQRSQIITSIFSWLKTRRHLVTFTAVDKSLYFLRKDSDDRLKSLKSLWCYLGIHILLSIQKYCQKFPKNKGNTVFIFDNELREETRFGEIVVNMPSWVEGFYAERKTNSQRLDQLIDVPYFGDSKDVHLIQVADFIAYFLRLYSELKEKKRSPKYFDEPDKVQGWINQILEVSLPVATRFPSRSRDDCAELFYSLAPDAIRTLGR